MKFHKSIKNRMLFGVCGGLGETFKVEPNVIRIVFVVLNLLTRLPLFLLYLILAFVLPYGQIEHTEEEESGFGDFGQGGSRTEYAPDAPPFDVSEAKDVEIDEQQ